MISGHCNGGSVRFECDETPAGADLGLNVETNIGVGVKAERGEIGDSSTQHQGHHGGGVG